MDHLITWKGRSMKHVVIVGGGISGLAAAYRLQMLAPEVKVTLVERESRLGGKIATERAHGFVVEGGADCFLARKPRGIALCEELGIAQRLQGRNPDYEKTYILRAGTLHRLPEGLTGMVPTDVDTLARSTLISWEGRARLMRDLELPPAPGNSDESVAEFISRRLGSEVFEQLIEPLMGGIYAGDAAQLSLAATFPELRALERDHGSLLRGLRSAAAAHRRGAIATSYPPFVAFRSGMLELVEVLQARLTQANIIVGTSVTTLKRSAEGFVLTLKNKQRLESGAVILATPAFVTAQLVAPLDPALAAAHRAIPYASVVTVSLAYEKDKIPHPLDGYGYLIPRIEGSNVLACTWSSNKWDGRAPARYTLLRVYLGRYGQRDLVQDRDEKLFTLARNELARTLAINEPSAFRWLFRWPQAMPQYTLGHPERLKQIGKQLTYQPGLFLAGAAYEGVGIPDCIRSGEQAAEAALASLNARVGQNAPHG
ncbi:MAG: protoporphyrinogen oxidase [Ardenticatenaceae bacterium]